jgi:type IV pilus assembly protein PilV
MWAFRQSNRKQKGAGFIEMMVALVILAIGLLGVLSMQTRGMRSNQQAEFTTDVTLLAQDMADRILAYGRFSAVGNVYHGIDTTGGGACNVAPPNPVVTDDCNGWISAFAQSQLPSAQGTVVWADPLYTITIHWDQNRVGGALAFDADGDCTNNDLTTTLSCFTLELQP